ncbi:MAG: GNAT family N-acetyltransferase, partial [Calditrichaeota bacterium]
PEAYLAFIERHPDASLFHHPQWHRALMLGLPDIGVSTAYYGLTDSAGALKGAFPVFSYRKYGVAFRGIHLPRLATPATPPLLAGCTWDAFLDAVEGWVRRQSFPYFRIVMPQAFSDECRSGGSFELEEHRNLELDLRAPLKAAWPKVGRKIRKAIRSGVRVHLGRPARFMEIYRPMLEETYGWQGKEPNIPDTLYRAVLEDSFLCRHLRLVYASMSGQAVAGAWFFHDRQRSYFWDGASLRVARNPCANHLIHWSNIRWSKRIGLTVYDMVGSGCGRDKERPGIGRFKRSFGATMQHYPVVVVWQGRLIRTALHAYREFRLRFSGGRHHEP